MWSVVRPCAWRILLVSWWLHSGVIGSSCRFIPWPMPVSGIRGTTVLLCSLVHLPRVILLVHPMWPRRLNSGHGHIPALPLPKFPLTKLPLAEFPLAKFHFPLLTFPFLALPVRHVPLIFVLHHPDGTLRIVLIRWPWLFPVGVHVGPAGFGWPGRTNARVLSWRAHGPRRYRAAGQSPRFPRLFGRGQWRASRGVSLRCAIALQFRS
jgi:hypothetical protein